MFYSFTSCINTYLLLQDLNKVNIISIEMCVKNLFVSFMVNFAFYSVFSKYQSGALMEKCWQQTDTTPV